MNSYFSFCLLLSILISVYTHEGNSDGSACVFPFTWRKKSYSSCFKTESTGDDTYMKCATTADYDRDGKWGKCSYPSTCNIISSVPSLSRMLNSIHLKISTLHCQFSLYVICFFYQNILNRFCLSLLLLFLPVRYSSSSFHSQCNFRVQKSKLIIVWILVLYDILNLWFAPARSIVISF